MKETAAQLAAMQRLLDASYRRASAHLRSIVTEERTLSARDIAGLMTGMRVLSLATVTATCEPRVSAVDGHFLHGRWTMSTDPRSPKGRQIRARPAVSAACVEGEELAVFTHGEVELLTPEHPHRDEVLDHWVGFYGASALPWDDVMLMEIRPTWMVGYAFRRADLLAARGVGSR